MTNTNASGLARFWKPISRYPWRRRVIGVALLALILIGLGVLASLLLTDSGPCCGPDRTSFKILAGTEAQPLEPLLLDYGTKHKLDIEMTYLGSVDIMRELEKGSSSRFDAVWPANSLWILLGDSHKAVTKSASVMRSPVVFGVKKSVAEQLGWVGTDVSVDQILAAAESGQMRFMMTSASQSDSGAAAYLGFLYAFAGHPDVLTSVDLTEPAVQEKTTRILGAEGGTAGDSGALAQQFQDRYDDFEAMVNDESAIIAVNQASAARGREPLYVVYPVDGIAIADWPFGLIDKKDAGQATAFRGLQQYLLSPDVQADLLHRGWRTGLGINLDPKTIDLAVFNPAWGIDTERVLSPIRLPEASVIREALDLYQTSFRKPSLTVWALDFSGSMRSHDGQQQLKAAMHQLLDPVSAGQSLLQMGPNDITVVIPFNHQPLEVWIVRGNEPAQLETLDGEIAALKADGGTDIYSAIIQGLDVIKRETTADRFPSIVVMTDGRSEDGKTLTDLTDAVAANGLGSVPIFAITFGDASEKQLREITSLSSGQIFDGRTDLMSAFRKARGYT